MATERHDPDDIAAYDFDLPDELIARHPPAQRDGGRLLVVHRQTQRIEHREVRDLPQFLHPADGLVLNDTRVLPARLRGRRSATGGKWEGLYLEAADDQTWRILSRTRGKIRAGECVDVAPLADSRLRLTLTFLRPEPQGVWLVRPSRWGAPEDVLKGFGHVPLPPYIDRPVVDADLDRYQTTYAKQPGAVAAPTAGLHLTPALLDDCINCGVELVFVTLHVGIGTFRPVSASNLDDHAMHAEMAEVTSASVEKLRGIKAAGGKVWAVGTTSVRTLESLPRSLDEVATGWRDRTDLFIRPPHAWRHVDGLLTNFHLPKSTLLVLVSALAGRELILRAYREAVEMRYRFFSYGDAMLIV